MINMNHFDSSFRPPVSAVQEEHMDIWRNNVDAILQVGVRVLCCMDASADTHTDAHRYSCVVNLPGLSLQNGFLRHRHDKTVKQSLYRRLMRSNH